MQLITLISEISVDRFSVASYFCCLSPMVPSFLKCLVISDYDIFLEYSRHKIKSLFFLRRFSLRHTKEAKSKATFTQVEDFRLPEPWKVDYKSMGEEVYLNVPI